MAEVESASAMKRNCSMRRGRWAIAAAAASAMMWSCADPEPGGDPGDYWDNPGWYSTVSEPIEWTDDPEAYEGISGDIKIEELREMVPPRDDVQVWYGFSEGYGYDDGQLYPVDGDCNPEFEFSDTIPENLEELPAVIEGVVTLHPRHFVNATICGSRERNFGTFIIQDESTGIHVLRDSRVGSFDVGDRVRLEVRGLARMFGTVAVTSFGDKEVLTTPQDRVPVYYEEIHRPFYSAEEAVAAAQEAEEAEEELDPDLPDPDDYEVRRICGIVTLEPTNQNFNQMIVRSEADEEIEWYGSIDRELGTRGVAPRLGERVQLTAPVVDGFEGMELLILSLGQIEYPEEHCEYPR